MRKALKTTLIELLNAIVGNPDNLYTMDGYVLGKPLATEIAGTKPLLGYLDYIINATDAATIDRYVRITTNKLTSTFVNGGFVDMKKLYVNYLTVRACGVYAVNDCGV